MLITLEEFQKILDYNEETGDFIWKVKRPGIRGVGCIAGSIDTHGYRQIYAYNKIILAHRLAWLYITKEWPKNQIDHIDMNRLNNKRSNLREATAHQNCRNRTKYSNNTSGYKGVCWHKWSERWLAQIRVNNELIHLGFFENIKDAACAYAAGAMKYHGEFARNSK